MNRVRGFDAVASMHSGRPRRGRSDLISGGLPGRGFAGGLSWCEGHHDGSSKTQAKRAWKTEIRGNGGRGCREKPVLGYL